jgi:hypothetical protein
MDSPCNWVSLQLHLLKYYLWKRTKLRSLNGIFNVTEASTNWSVDYISKKFCKPNVPLNTKGSVQINTQWQSHLSHHLLTL